MTQLPVDDATLAAVAAAVIGSGRQVRVVDWLSRQIFAGDGRGLCPGWAAADTFLIARSGGLVRSRGVV
ncbi:MAG TPA: hypothetical protein VJ649_10295 [Actinomycetes bacterium]|nr:hypothetical protein [Actinomycetes bacterium]